MPTSNCIRLFIYQIPYCSSQNISHFPVLQGAKKQYSSEEKPVFLSCCSIICLLQRPSSSSQSATRKKYSRLQLSVPPPPPRAFLPLEESQKLPKKPTTVPLTNSKTHFCSMHNSSLYSQIHHGTLLSTAKRHTLHVHVWNQQTLA